MPSGRDVRSEPTSNNNASRGQDKDKTPKARTMNGTLDGWVEPSLATKPSFEDHGGAPYGVLEHMQPLGEPPSTRVRARVKGDGARKSLAGRSAAGTALDAQDTPEGTPGPMASSQAMVDAMPPLPPIPMDDEDDDDYAPGKKSKKKERAAKPRGSKRQSESAGPPAEAPSTGKGRGRGKRNAEKVVEKAFETPAVDDTPDVINMNRIYTPMKLKSVVEEAKKRAYDAGKPNLAEAVEEVYQQSLKSARLTELLEAILEQTATKEQSIEFQVHVRAAKKKLRAAKAAGERKVPATATNGDKVLPLPVRSPVKGAQPVQLKDEPAIPSTEKSEIPKPKFSIKVRSPPKPETGRSTPQDKTTSSSPIKLESEQRDDDLSDLSELTELSEGEEMTIDTPEERDDMSAGPPSNMNGVKVKDQAAERGSLGVQGMAQKRSSADAEIYETEDDRILSAKKLKLSGKVTRDYDYQDSHLRSSLSGLPRTSRGPSAKNGAFTPAKITLHPHGGGNTSARGSRAISVDADSPLSSPAGSSRRSTPHVWKGPPKQTGKRAKTKTS